MNFLEEQYLKKGIFGPFYPISRKGTLINTNELYKQWFKEDKPDDMPKYIFIEDVENYNWYFEKYDWYNDPRTFLVQDDKLPKY